MSADLAALVEVVRGRRVVILTGAGVSTASGIPDYRGAGRSPRRSIQYREFLDHAAVRARYWARSAVGWPKLAAARPNPAHVAVAALETSGATVGVITQNVDGLHGVAGSQAVVELHGALARVRCLGCAALVSRDELQARLCADNSASIARAASIPAAPDGDADLHPRDLADFVVPSCRACGGVLKPDVVFFGESVAPPTLAAAWALFDRAEVLLVAGSSLAVFSGYRFVIRAVERGMPVAVVNLGPTRGDAAATVKVEAAVDRMLPALAEMLSHGSSGA